MAELLLRPVAGRPDLQEVTNYNIATSRAGGDRLAFLDVVTGELRACVIASAYLASRERFLVVVMHTQQQQQQAEGDARMMHGDEDDAERVDTGPGVDQMIARGFTVACAAHIVDDVDNLPPTIRFACLLHERDRDAAGAPEEQRPGAPVRMGSVAVQVENVTCDAQPVVHYVTPRPVATGDNLVLLKITDERSSDRLFRSDARAGTVLAVFETSGSMSLVRGGNDAHVWASTAQHVLRTSTEPLPVSLSHSIRQRFAPLFVECGVANAFETCVFSLVRVVAGRFEHVGAFVSSLDLEHVPRDESGVRLGGVAHPGLVSQLPARTGMETVVCAFTPGAGRRTFRGTLLPRTDVSEVAEIA